MRHYARDKDRARELMDWHKKDLVIELVDAENMIRKLAVFSVLFCAIIAYRMIFAIIMFCIKEAS